METSKRFDAGQQERLGRLMWEISEGSTFASPASILQSEIDAAIVRTFQKAPQVHPLALVRPTLDKMNVITSAQLSGREPGQWVKVAGLVLVRQRPGTASGIVFETIEDETGVVNLIIRPDLYDRSRHAARHAALLQADGYVERSGQVIHVMAKRLIDLSHLLPGYDAMSRDFH